jgi:uncharacterized protein (TIGR02996 family)
MTRRVLPWNLRDDPDAGPLLRKVLERPFAARPRLDFAGWLETNGDNDRADLIRLQICRGRFCRCRCALDEMDIFAEHLPESLWDLAWKLAQSARDRVLEQKERWQGFRSSWPKGGGDLRGGFFSVIGTTVDDLTENASLIFSEHPVVWVWLLGHGALQRSGAWTIQLGTKEEPEDERTRFWLPHRIWEPSRHLISRGTWPTESAAQFFLSLLCVNFGRRAAGLPLLTPEDFPGPHDTIFGLHNHTDNAQFAFAE